MRILSLSVLIAVLAAPAAGQLLPPVGGLGPVGGGALRPLDPLLVPTAAPMLGGPMLGGPIGISGLVDAGKRLGTGILWHHRRDRGPSRRTRRDPRLAGDIDRRPER